MVYMTNLALADNRSYNAGRKLKALSDTQNVASVMRLMIQRENILASGMEVQQLDEAIELMNK